MDQSRFCHKDSHPSLVRRALPECTPCSSSCLAAAPFQSSAISNVAEERGRKLNPLKGRGDEATARFVLGSVLRHERPHTHCWSQEHAPAAARGELCSSCRRGARRPARPRRVRADACQVQGPSEAAGDDSFRLCSRLVELGPELGGSRAALSGHQPTFRRRGWQQPDGGAAAAVHAHQHSHPAAARPSQV